MTITLRKKMQVANALTFAVALYVRFFPLGLKTIEEVVNYYQHPLSPMEFTIYIWHVIFFLQAVFVVYQFSPNAHALIFDRLGYNFVALNVLSILWAVTLRYELIALAIIPALGMVGILAVIYEKVNRQDLTCREFVLVQLPFRMYTAWMSLYTLMIASATGSVMGWISVTGASVLIPFIGLLGIMVTQFTRSRDVIFGSTVVFGIIGIGLGQIMHKQLFFISMFTAAVMVGYISNMVVNILNSRYHFIEKIRLPCCPASGEEGADSEREPLI